MSDYREYWYEDDAVYYGKHGKGSYPVVPKIYEKCYYDRKGKRKIGLKPFRSHLEAYLALSYATHFVYHKHLLDHYNIFRCKKCGNYHVVKAKTYEKYIKNKFEM